MTSAAPLNAEAAGRRDAHLEECLACRGHLRRRSGLLSLIRVALLAWATAVRARVGAWTDGPAPPG